MLCVFHQVSISGFCQNYLLLSFSQCTDKEMVPRAIGLYFSAMACENTETVDDPNTETVDDPDTTENDEGENTDIL